MVSRIEVIPSEVRGYGNIVGAKSVDDFVPVGSELSFSENVYSLTALEGLRITLTASSSSISYGSSVSLSATVVEDDSPVTGVSVTFYDGESSLGSATTNSSGVATYTTSSLTVGSHSCTAVYDEKTSNSVSVAVNKLASTISLTVPASGTVGTAYTVTGTLVPSSGSVKLYENGSLKDTLTVSSGSFSKSITQSNEGTYSYYAVFEGSSTYEGSTSSIQSITVEAIPVPSYNGVSLSSNKSILSKYNSESATLTAQLLDGSTPASVSGVTVEFFKGSTSLGTATTNSNGVATKSYSSTGAGDVSLTASVDSYTSTAVTIEDCLMYDATEYSRTGTGSATSVATNSKTWDNTIDWELTADIKVTGASCRIDVVPPSQSLSYHLGIGKNGSSQLATYVGKNGGGEDTIAHTSYSINNNTYYAVKITRENGTIKYYFNGNLVRTETTYATVWIDNYSTESVKFTTWARNTIYMKNIKVKPL